MLDIAGLRRTLLLAGALALLAIGVRLALGANAERAPARIVGAGSSEAASAPAAGARPSLRTESVIRFTEPMNTEGSERDAAEPGADAPEDAPPQGRTLVTDADAALLGIEWRGGALFVARSVDLTFGLSTLYAWTEDSGRPSTPVPLELPEQAEQGPHVSWDGRIVGGAANEDAALLLGSVDAHIDGRSALAEQYPEVMEAVEAEGAFAVALSEDEDSLDTRVRVIGSDGREVLATTLAELGIEAPPLADTRRPVLWRSTDAETWDPIDVRSAFGEYVLLEAVAERDGQLVAVGTGTYGEPAAWTSRDGATWEPVAADALAPILEEVLPAAGEDVLAARQDAPPTLP